jgi:hypothetical protein
MKAGIIIIFQNCEKEIDKYFFIEHLTNLKEIKLCLVNNSSKDNTYHVLKEISEACKNVSVVNIKKIKSQISAVRAGARYMFNQFNITQLSYVLNLLQYDLNDFVECISHNQEVIVNYHLYKSGNETKQTLFRGLYSAKDYLEELNIKDHIHS